MAISQGFAASFNVKWPLLQAPMAGVADVELAIAVAKAGGIGALACGVMSNEAIVTAVARYRKATSAPLNLNFYAHPTPEADSAAQDRWAEVLLPYFQAFDLQPAGALGVVRQPFTEAACALVEELKPEIVSFHFGLPEQSLLARVRQSGAKIVSTATTFEEAQDLEARGCDAIIAQGIEAGGHRGTYLTSNVSEEMSTVKLVEALASSIQGPIIATGGIGRRLDVDALMAAGASAVQVGTAFMLCPECATSALHRQAFSQIDQTAITNIFTGRPARGLVNRAMKELGTIRADVPSYPLAAGLMGVLRAHAEAKGKVDFSPLWAGTGYKLAEQKPVADVILELMA